MYIQITFKNIAEITRDIMIAQLQEDAEGFEEDDARLNVFFLEENYPLRTIEALADKYDIHFETKRLPTQNWNAVWESNFEPVRIRTFAGIRASFHPAINNVSHEIIITPKMSFGTGHHASTALMIEAMQQHSFNNKSVFDFGTGTGILAILAKKLGAAYTLASDLDDWSIQNAEENFVQNNVEGIQLIKSSAADIGKEFDYILANINRNVLISHAEALAAQLGQHSILIVSGILHTDANAITRIYRENGMKLIQQNDKEKWICLTFSRLK